MIRKTQTRRVVGKKGLLLEAEILQKARLGRHVQIVVREGEIRLLPVEEEENWQETLDDLAGCLGTERVEDYDFDLKIRHPYEA